MSLNWEKASKIAMAWLLAGMLTGCVNNPAYTSLDGSPRTSSPPSQPSRTNADEPVRLGSSAPRPTQSATASTTRPDYYRVQPGDTLYSIAFRYGLDFRRLAHANNISSNYTIHPGQQLALRESEPVKSTQLMPAPTANTRPTTSSSVTRESAAGGTVASSPAAASPPVTENNNSSVSVRITPTPTTPHSSQDWAWPHDGKIVRTFNANVSDQKGVDLAGQIGDSVKAAANGTVVYAGNGLPGYGNLIIVEHSGSLLSAYAFNQELLVSEQDTVSKGQVIARMGSQGDQPRLHFEIRQEGKPVDPMRYLPRR